MEKVIVSDQFAPNSVTSRNEFAGSAVPVIESALQHANLRKLSARMESGHGVIFKELPVTGLLVLRAQSDKPALQAAVKSTLKLDLPDVLQCSADSDSETHCIRWVAPDEWMLSCPLDVAFDIETKLRAELTDKSVAIVNVSGGFTVLRLSGEHANDVLKKSVAYDVHPANFSTGKVVNTVLAKAQVTLRCVSANDYEIIVRRSFADYLWHWLQVASIEYGLGVESEG